MDEQQADESIGESRVKSGLQTPVTHCRPVGQPEFVHQLTKILFAPYRVEGGTVSLVGCSLDEVPFLIVSEAGQDARQFYDREGRALTESLAASLGLESLESIPTPPQSIRPSSVKGWAEEAIANLSPANLKAFANPVFQIVWCRWAHGKLSIQIGDSSHQLPFQGWASQFASGQIRPPRFTCTKSGRHAYEVVATDDGQLTVPAAIEVCAASGQRCIDAELESCQATGVRVLPEYLVRCTATGERVVASALAACPQCDQQVARRGIEGGKCPLCRQLKSMDLAQSPWQAALAQSPFAAGLRRWKLAAGPQTIVATGASWRLTILFVIDRELGQIITVRRRPLWARHWSTEFQVEKPGTEPSDTQRL